MTYSIFLLLGGIGLFLFGINFMQHSLEDAAGDNLRKILERLTSRGIYAFLIGIVVTAMIQSSGATMVMAVGFVNAGLMTLAQAMYIMLGAAVGTTVTAQIIAFDIAPISPLILFAGMVMYLFIKNKKVRKAGGIVLGFGLLFVGIYLMSTAVDQLALGDIVAEFLREVSNPFLSLLFGFAITFIIQSSSAAVGILQVIVSSAVGASFSLSSVVFMIMGMNVGSVAPAVLSSIGGNARAKRAALAQLIIKLICVVLFSVVILLIPSVLTGIESLSPGTPERQIANLHLIYNVTTALMIFPFTRKLAEAIEKLMPDEEVSEGEEARSLIYVSRDMSQNSALMISLAKKEVLRFADLCVGNLKLSLKGFFEENENYNADIKETEENIDVLNHDFNAYMVELSGKEMPEHESRQISVMLSVMTDLERIGDHAENISEYTSSLVRSGGSISEAAEAEIREMAEKTVRMVDLSVDIFANKRFDLIEQARQIEDEVDDMENKCIEDHINRLKAGDCEPRGGVIYTDLVSDLERISDHALNIAEAILGAIVI